MHRSFQFFFFPNTISHLSSPAASSHTYNEMLIETGPMTMLGAFQSATASTVRSAAFVLVAEALYLAMAHDQNVLAVRAVTGIQKQQGGVGPAAAVGAPRCLHLTKQAAS